MPRKPRKPAKLTIGAVRARAVRGPHKSGDGRWYWRAELYADGASRTVWTGWATRDVAAQDIARLVADDALDAPRDARAEPERADTVRDLLELWAGAQERREDIAPLTRGQYIRTARRILRRLDRHRLDRLDRRALDDYRDGCLRAGSATATVALDFRVLRLAWKWGRRRGLTPDRDLDPPRVRIKPVRTKRTPTRAEVAAVLGQLDGWKAVALTLLAATGARVGEVGRLRWEDVDLRGGWLTLTGKGKTRRVPLAPEARAALEAWGPGQGKVLGVTRDTAVMKLRVAIYKACDAIDVERFTPHGVRRLAVDEMLRAGVDPGTAARITGHSPIVMLRYYQQATDEDLKRAVARAGLGTAPRGEVVAFPRQGG